MLHFWFWVSGAHNNSWAILWGGVFSCLGYIGWIVSSYRNHNCHSKGCPWIGHHEYEKDGVKYKLCRRCHPAVDHTDRLRRHHFHAHHSSKVQS